MKRRDQIEGCLLGCAIGDSIGLPFEGLSPRRVAKLRQRPLRQSLWFGRGMVSDDTDHSIFVAQALTMHPADPYAFARVLARRLRVWLLCLPAGVGFATLRSLVKSWLGFSPQSSGVFSAGNGAAMRTAILGVFHHQEPELRRKFVACSTRITHSDPKADFGAQAVAATAALATVLTRRPDLNVLTRTLMDCGEGEEWQATISATIDACRTMDLSTALPVSARNVGVSGYIYHTLPVAIAAWYIYYGDFRATIEEIVDLGGDTDTVAAIAGSLAGITMGRTGIPRQWIEQLCDHPHSPKFIANLATAVSQGDATHSGFAWMLLLRGWIFTPIVLVHGLRRIFPPY